LLKRAKLPLLDPEEMFRQAHTLLEQPSQSNLRRAISAAYYGLFHAIARAAADVIVGKEYRETERYDWVYRSVQHTKLRDLCKNSKWKADFRNFAETVIQLQEAREEADYSALLTATPSDTISRIAAAQNAVALFEAASDNTRLEFVTLLFFKPRRP
jgi:hypothetical protein